MRTMSCRQPPTVPQCIRVDLAALGRAQLTQLLALVLAFALASVAPALAAEAQLHKVADNVYALIGSADPVSPQNRGRVANAGFIVGRSGVIVIDTGVSYRHGKQLLESIRQVTQRPIELVIITHAVREFVFGAAAFEETGARLMAHRETLALMNARCAHCLAQLGDMLGEEMANTRLVLPRETVNDTTLITAGGEHIELLYFGWAATPGDLAVYHPSSGTLFGGGLVSAHHVPPIRDADFTGWQNALEALTELAPTHVVPGFGPPSGPEAIVATAGYLHDLDQQARQLYADSVSLLEAMENAGLARYAAWHAYEPNHRRNALHRRLQLETEDLGGDPRSTAMPDGPP